MATDSLFFLNVHPSDFSVPLPPTSAANWLKPPDLDQKKRQAPRYLTRAYWHNNSRKLLFLCSYACLSLLLFLGAMLQHRQGGGWYMVAKGCGQCLNFNCTFVMVPVRRWPSPERSHCPTTRRRGTTPVCVCAGVNAAALPHLAEGHLGGAGPAPGPEHPAAPDRGLRHPGLHTRAHHCTHLQLW